MPASLRITVAGQWRTCTAFPAATIQIGKQQDVKLNLLGFTIVGHRSTRESVAQRTQSHRTKPP